jgi:outer membrane lipoprotein-sorting protein
MPEFRRLVLLVALGGLIPPAGADEAETRGLELARAAEAHDAGWQDVRAEVEMILRDKAGRESRRLLRIATLEIRNDGDLSLTVFDSPRDVAGTAFLSHTHALTPDEQWLYLPALRRVKRIASANKSGPFVGSEFAYEDLTSQEIARYRYRWLRDEMLDGRATHVQEESPAYPHSGYSRRIVWLDQAMLQPLKVEFYDRRNALLKTLTFDGYTEYLDRHWRAARLNMENHRTGKRTALVWKQYRFRTGLSARDFDRNALKRAR